MTAVDSGGQQRSPAERFGHPPRRGRGPRLPSRGASRDTVRPVADKNSDAALDPTSGSSHFVVGGAFVGGASTRCRSGGRLRQRVLAAGGLSLLRPENPASRGARRTGRSARRVGLRPQVCIRPVVLACLAGFGCRPRSRSLTLGSWLGAVCVHPEFLTEGFNEAYRFGRDRSARVGRPLGRLLYVERRPLRPDL